MKTIDMGAMDPKHRRDAINEVRVLSCLKHPYIVSYRESFSENHHGNNTLSIVMDYADGGDLYQRINRTRKTGQALAERQILRWLTEAALALKYIHDKHVLHRDLKSQNLFLTSSDRIRMGDFGISKVLENTAAFAKTAIGTPYYLSPEICQEKPYSFGSDIWALGCVLYEMTALRVPFDAQNIQSLVQKITRGPLPQVPSPYSQELRQLCGDLLHRDQTQRPTATDIIQRQYVQEEIRRMLMEERSKANSGGPSTAGANSNGAPVADLPPQQSRPPLGGPSQAGHHTPSSKPGEAQQVHRRPASYRSYSPAAARAHAAQQQGQARENQQLQQPHSAHGNHGGGQHPLPRERLPS
jgi:NIMA (never in mitosis gene a)-related kinase